MPLVTIDLLEGRVHNELDAISDAVHDAMVECLAVPNRDRFQLINQHPPSTLRFDRHYLDIDRSERFVLVRITLSAGRSAATKQAFYRRLSELLASRAGLAPADLTIILTENHREDWCFGHGQASYLELPPEAWR